jgi:hypothetical protein
MIGYIVLIGHTIIGNVIDTDHWRHFYLLMGVVWGCTRWKCAGSHGCGPGPGLRQGPCPPNSPHNKSQRNGREFSSNVAPHGR